jgi:putative DNA primase/helicase
MSDPKPDEFVEFLDLLTENAPEDYRPWLFRVKPDSKAPATEYGSWKHQESRMSKHEAIDWMESGGNVGIAGRPYDPLINLDIDDEDQTTIDDLKQTLIARSRSRTGVHAWYFEAPGADIPNIPTDAAGEVRAKWQYVVAPGSYVDTDPDNVPVDQRESAGY